MESEVVIFFVDDILLIQPDFSKLGSFLVYCAMTRVLRCSEIGSFRDRNAIEEDIRFIICILVSGGRINIFSFPIRVVFDGQIEMCLRHGTNAC